MTESKSMFHLMRSVDRAFATAGQLPVGGSDDWHQIKRHITRMRCALGFVRTTLRVERRLGIPLSEETARKIEGYADWPLAKMEG
jgi:hypothetical protein